MPYAKILRPLAPLLVTAMLVSAGCGGPANEEPLGSVSLAMRKLESGPSISLKDMKDKGVAAYLKENPLPNKACITCPLDDFKLEQKGEVLALLKQIPDNQRDRVIELDLDHGWLVDEDLPQIPKLFPKLQKISLGLLVGAEALGQLVESLPALQSLGLRRLNLGKLADEHIIRLVKATQKGALQKLTTLMIGQTKVSPNTLQSLFAVLPKLTYLILAGTDLDPHVPKLLAAFKSGGSLANLQSFGVQIGISISPENFTELMNAFPGNGVDLENFFGNEEEERLEALDEAVSQGGLKNLIHLNLSHNKGLPAKPLAKFLGKLAEHGKLQELELVDMDLQEEHMEALQEEVQAGRFKEIRSLKLDQNPALSFDGVVAVAAGMPKRSRLTVEGMHLTDKAVQGFKGGLTALDLRGCTLSPTALESLAQKSPGLKNLDLFGTKLTDAHLDALGKAKSQGALQGLEQLQLGGEQLFSGAGLQRLAEVVGDSLQGWSFTRGVLVGEHVEGLYEAAKSGKLGGLCRIDFGISSTLGKEIGQNSDPLVKLVCSLSGLESLGLYCVATDPLLQSLLTQKNNGELPKLKQVNVMECRKITPKTLYDLHVALPEQPLTSKWGLRMSTPMRW